MNTNLTMLQEAGNAAGAVVQQMQSWPPGVLFGVCLMVLAVALKTMGVPRRWNVIAVLVVGTGWAALLGDTSKVPHPHPRIILGMWGLCIAALALITFKVLHKRLEKYLPELGRKEPEEDKEP